VTKDEVLALNAEEGGGAYDPEWEDQDWFEDLVKDRDVARAMIEMSDGDVFHYNVEQFNCWKKR